MQVCGVILSHATVVTIKFTFQNKSYVRKCTQNIIGRETKHAKRIGKHCMDAISQYPYPLISVQCQQQTHDEHTVGLCLTHHCQQTQCIIVRSDHSLSYVFRRTSITGCVVVKETYPSGALAAVEGKPWRQKTKMRTSTVHFAARVSAYKT